MGKEGLNYATITVTTTITTVTTTRLIRRTAADNLAEGSPASWFLVFASALWFVHHSDLDKDLIILPPRSPVANLLISPWLVLGVVVMLMKRVGTLSAPAASFSSTLIMLWPDDEERVL